MIVVFDLYFYMCNWTLINLQLTARLFRSDFGFCLVLLINYVGFRGLGLVGGWNFLSLFFSIIISIQYSKKVNQSIQYFIFIAMFMNFWLKCEYFQRSSYLFIFVVGSCHLSGRLVKKYNSYRDSVYFHYLFKHDLYNFFV